MFISLIHAYQDPHNYAIKATRAFISKGLFLICLASMLCCMYNRNRRITWLFLFGKVAHPVSLPMLAQGGIVGAYPQL